MTEIWIDAQLSPALAAWINRTYEEITAKSVHAVELLDAEDEEIFRAARKAGVVMMSKDSNFLKRMLPPAVQMREADETIVEIGDLYGYISPYCCRRRAVANSKR